LEPYTTRRKLVLAVGKNETNVISTVLRFVFIYLKLRGEMYVKYSLESFVCLDVSLYMFILHLGICIMWMWEVLLTSGAVSILKVEVMRMCHPTHFDSDGALWHIRT
jgi:hypothetical protein